MQHTATYSPEDNKLRLYPAARLDADEYASAKAHGFKWAPAQKLFVAPMWTPERAAWLERMAGEIGDEDQSLVDRAEIRAERFEGYSENRMDDAERAREAVSSIADNIPLGQPILVGHHSERHARRDAEKIENGMRKAVKMWECSKYWQSRAKGALRAAKYKELPGVRVRRIKGLEADRRKQQRNKEKAELCLQLWTKEGLTIEAARVIARRSDCGWLPLPRKEGDRPDFEGHQTASGALDDAHPTLYAPRTLEEILEAARSHYPRLINYAAEWIAHLDNRLEYEKAMLTESGFTMPEKAKRPALPPLLNYRAKEIRTKNRWHRGEFEMLPQVEMTAGDYARIYTDYKCTADAADGSHRVRVTIERVDGKRREVCVFVTDSKEHPAPTTPPPAESETEVFERENMDALNRVFVTPYCDLSGSDKDRARVKVQLDQFDEEEKTKTDEHGRAVYADPPAVILAPDSSSAPIGKPCPKEPPHTEAVQVNPAPVDPFEAMRESLKAGVRVVSAPQLFPTPAELARRVVELADIRLGNRILEPSAGTGALLNECLEKTYSGLITAIEINLTLAHALAAKFPTVDVRRGDFLEFNGEIGIFDRILMNPPFQNGDDIRHIQHARAKLAPGGRLVAICANGPRQRAKLEPECEQWIDLPAGSFSSSGTNVNSAIVIFEA